MADPRCSAITNDGTRCKNPCAILFGEGYDPPPWRYREVCILHHRMRDPKWRDRIKKNLQKARAARKDRLAFRQELLDRIDALGAAGG